MTFFKGHIYKFFLDPQKLPVVKPKSQIEILKSQMLEKKENNPIHFN